MAQKQTEIINALLPFSKEGKTITYQIKRKEEMDYSSWNYVGIFSDGVILFSKMSAIIALNPSS